MRCPEPTSDAKWCLEQMFQHMEINLRNRVEAKTGRATSLELNKLSNLMSHAGLAHPGKVRSLLSPTRLRRLEGDITLTPEQRTALREVFIYYCSWAEKHNYMFMSSSQFLRFCRDTFIMAGDLDAVALALLFGKVQLESPEQAPGGRITMVDWLQTLMLIALQQMGSLSPQEAWDRLINDYVLMFGAKVDCTTDRLATVMLQPDVVEAVGQAKHKLQPVFRFYVNEQSISTPETSRQRRPLPTIATTISALSRPLSPAQTEPVVQQQLLQLNTSGRPSATLVQDCEPPALSNSGGAQHVLDSAAKRLQGIQAGSGLLPPGTAASHRSQSVQQAKVHMPLPTFLRFLQDFDVLPKLINKSQATKCFREARFGPGHEQEEGSDIGRIDFVEFMDAIARCALVAYNFQIKAEPERLLAFEDSYHPGAKHLWSSKAREALQETLSYPDEVIVPAADRDECIGAEDSPHYDEGVESRWGGRCGARSARSARSVAIYRTARSLANYRVKQTLVTPSGEGGAEVMALHDEASHLDNNRPLHLKTFHPDWVGKPGVPFSETNVLKRRFTDRALESGVYTGTEVGLPPLFKQRAEDMIEARTMREQAMEALRLMYVSQRRVEQRERMADVTARRQELQLLSRQQVVEQTKQHTDFAQALAELQLLA